MIGYASNTGTIRNLNALRAAGWRILLTPDNPIRREGLRYGIDNGAWKAFKQRQPFDAGSFESLVDRNGEDADFIVLPDIVAGGMGSLEFSLSWLPKLNGATKLLLPVQDGMGPHPVVQVLAEHPNVGIFLGGSTEWKLQTMFDWGVLAAALGRHYHIGRVNTARRIRLAEEAGADSFDGTSATMFSCTLPLLESSRQCRSLFSARRCTHL